MAQQRGARNSKSTKRLFPQLIKGVWSGEGSAVRDTQHQVGEFDCCVHILDLLILWTLVLSSGRNVEQLGETSLRMIKTKLIMGLVYTECYWSDFWRLLKSANQWILACVIFLGFFCFYHCSVDWGKLKLYLLNSCNLNERQHNQPGMVTSNRVPF